MLIRYCEIRRPYHLSSVLTAAALPYIPDIVRGRAYPRITSWGIWTVVQPSQVRRARELGLLAGPTSW